MLQTEAYLTIVIYDHKTFIVQAKNWNNSRKNVLIDWASIEKTSNKNIGIFLGQVALTIRFAYVGDKATPHL